MTRAGTCEGLKVLGRCLVLLAALFRGLCVAAPESRSDAEAAQLLIKNGKFTDAAAKLNPWVERNDPDALVLRGILDATGAGVPLDHRVATERWQAAAHQGQRDAIRLLLPGLLFAGLTDEFQVSWWQERLAAASSDVVRLPGNLLVADGPYLRTDPAGARAWNEAGAKKEDPVALLNLFEMGELDWAARQNKALVLAPLQRAAALGYPPALAELASQYDATPGGSEPSWRLLEVNKELAVKYLERAAEAGHPNAQLLWGHRLSSGRGVAQDGAKAVEFYRRASDQGDAYAAYFMWKALREGELVPQDEVEADKYLRLAAERGNTSAVWFWSQRLFHGQGVGPDEAKALDMLIRSLLFDNLANEEAIAFVAWAFRTGRGVARDDFTALRWARWGARKGSAYCKYQIGLQYLNGEGVTADPIAAYVNLLAAQSAGYHEADFAVGYCLAQGIGTAQDLSRAESLLEKVRAQKGPDAVGATLLLGSMKFGDFGGNEADEAEARALWREAAAAGDQSAAFRLVVIEAEELREEQAVETIAHALTDYAAKGAKVAKQVLEHEPDPTKAARLFFGFSELPGEAEIQRRLGALPQAGPNSPPRPVFQPPPQYPFFQRMKRRPGKVVVEFVIDLDGRTLNPRVLSATDFNLGREAVRTVRRWRFSPGYRDGQPVRIRASQLLEFNPEQ